MAKSWEDNFSELVKNTLSVDTNKEWRFVLEESKTKGTMQVNVRKFSIDDGSGRYVGPSKNGFIEQIKTIEDLESLEKFNNALGEFLKQAKEML